MKQEEIKKDLKEYSAISSLAVSDGGKILIKKLYEDLSIAVESLTGVSELTEFIKISVSIEQTCNMLRSLGLAETNGEFARRALESEIKEDNKTVQEIEI